MNDIAIDVKGLTKTYKMYSSPKARLKEIIFRKPYHNVFVCLNNINFTVKRGMTLGIIGENGAGKSTLLKILAKTLKPTEGTVVINGVVSSLLELGSGLHPEFSGLENIYFYGSLLGIDKNNIEKKIKEIIDFAEIGEFINYPIKIYSSGMFVRLAFSVATSINPDIMIIDEALSVGDQYFQAKCLDKIAEFRKLGKTIVFCSHDMYQIKTFCDETIWLQKGKIIKLGNTDYVVNEYINNEISRSDRYKEQKTLSKEEKAIEQDKSFIHIKGLSAKHLTSYDIEVNFIIVSKIEFSGHIGWSILRHDNLQITFDSTKEQGLNPITLHGETKIRIIISDINIVQGNYLLYVGIFDKKAYKPIAVHSIPIDIKTGYDILNCVCHIKSSFLFD